MKLSTLIINRVETAAIVVPSGLVPLDTLNALSGSHWKTNIYDLLSSGQWDALHQWYRQGGREQLASLTALPRSAVQFGPLYRNPGKLWGIGMNYVSDPAQLQARAPEPDDEPVSFLKPATSIIGPNDAIVLPPQSSRVTAEAELGIIIGKKCRNLSSPDAAADVIAGFTCVLDMSADDIHQRNPRFLTRAKSFDTFFSFGPELATPDELGNLEDLLVENALNGEARHGNIVANMKYRPLDVIAFHSRVMTLLPGDVIYTGTPGSIVISAGDVAECRIPGLAPLTNPVISA